MPLAPGSSTQNTFVFIEVFGCEGGIQSYIKDVLMAYASLKDMDTAHIFLLRDRLEDIPPEFRSRFKFHCFKSGNPMVERIRLTLALGSHLLLQRPRRLFCGHINLATMVRQLSRLSGIPYTIFTYGKEVWFPLNSGDGDALRAADRVWTISRYSAKLACDANQLTPHNIDFLPCVVDGEAFTPAKAKAQLQAKYDLADARVLMTVARLWKGDPYKGVDVTIRALPEIASKFPDVKYLVIGRGDDQPRLAKLAEDLGVADRVIFAGFVPSEELVDHYRLADVYVMPSQEGFGIVYLEAMACGIPVISGDDDGSADPLQDGRLGWRVPHRDPAAVAVACIEALQGDDTRCDGVWLREQSLAKFSKTALPQQLQKLLQNASVANVSELQPPKGNIHVS